MVGSFSDGIGRILLALAGLQTTSAAVETPGPLCKATSEAPDLVANAPAAFDDYCHPWAGSAIPQVTKTIYSENGTPALVSHASGANRIAAWNPPDLRSLEGKPLSQVWDNTGAPYALAAGVFTDMLSANSALHAAKIDLKQTMNVAAWRTRDGGFRILTGNLEEGLRDDANLTRSAALLIPDSWRMTRGAWRDAWTGHTINAENGALRITLPQASSVLLEPTR
jgi:hypothetical protein